MTSKTRYFLAFVLALSTSLPVLAAPCVVNVSTCDAATCAFLPGVGAELDAVKGVGAVTLAKLRPFVVYGAEPTTCTSKQVAEKAPAAPAE